MLKEEAMVIKERLNKDDLTSFTASNGWLEMFKFARRRSQAKLKTYHE